MSGSKPYKSVQPIFHAKARNLPEVGEISTEHRCIIGERDARNPQVQRTHANSLAAQFIENPRSVLIPREQRPAVQHPKASPKPSVRVDLATAVPGTSDERQPAPQ
jgi:hypothetical protein